MHRNIRRCGVRHLTAQLSLYIQQVGFLDRLSAVPLHRVGGFMRRNYTVSPCPCTVNHPVQHDTAKPQHRFFLIHINFRQSDVSTHSFVRITAVHMTWRQHSACALSQRGLWSTTVRRRYGLRQHSSVQTPDDLVIRQLSIGQGLSKPN